MGISVGLVGLGGFGSEFADLFRSHPAVDRVALCDMEPDRVARFAEKESWRGKFDPSDAYNSLDEICKSDLDALVIITQPTLHAPQAIQAMESGKHVYSAVPIISLPDGDEILDWCDRLVKTCERTGMRYMLGETTYYVPQAMYCRRRAAEGAFGRFVHAEGQYLHDVDEPACNLREVRKWRRSSKAGREITKMLARYEGVISGPMHYPTHSVSGPISVMGARMTQVCAWGQEDETGDDYFKGALTNEIALFRMSNGATARIAECRKIAHTGEVTFCVLGTMGSFRPNYWMIRGQRTDLTIEDMRDPLPQAVQEAYREGLGSAHFYGGHGGSHAYLVHEFCDAIANDREPAINVWEAVRYMAAGVMAHKSALAGGEVLDVPDWGDPPADR
ncbi:MAG: Gfo/Idh/MocA family oxidoreductase [Planctomycetes bacterium]|nr:Gfo/Idh/MocA family oxidoreductase [Planctomycetota bacterium]